MTPAPTASAAAVGTVRERPPPSLPTTPTPESRGPRRAAGRDGTREEGRKRVFSFSRDCPAQFRRPPHDAPPQARTPLAAPDRLGAGRCATPAWRHETATTPRVGRGAPDARVPPRARQGACRTAQRSARSRRGPLRAVSPMPLRPCARGTSPPRRPAGGRSSPTAARRAPRRVRRACAPDRPRLERTPSGVAVLPRQQAPGARQRTRRSRASRRSPRRQSARRQNRRPPAPAARRLLVQIAGSCGPRCERTGRERPG